MSAGVVKGLDLKVHPIEMGPGVALDTLALLPGPPPFEESAEPGPALRVRYQPPGTSASTYEPWEYRLRLQQPELAGSVARLVRSIYLLHGSAGLKILGPAIEQRPAGPPTGRAPVPSMPQPEGAAEAFAEFEIHERQLLDGVQPALVRIEDVARAIALASARASHAAVHKEAVRFFGPNASVVDDRKLRDYTLQAEAVETLREMMRIIAPHRRLLRDSERQVREALNRPRQVDIRQRELQNLMATRMTRQERGDSPGGADAKRVAGPNPLTYANDALWNANAALLGVVGAAGRQSPILYRLWNKPEIIAMFSVDAPHRMPSEQQEADFRHNAVLKQTIFDELARTQRAADRVIYGLDKKQMSVWRFPPLINRALERLGVPEATVEWQAANERLAAEQASVLSIITGAAALVELGAMVAKAAPPIALGAGVIGFVADAVDFVKDRWQEEEEADLFNMAFNPADSFAAEPTFGLADIASLACLLLQAGSLLPLKA